MQETVAFIVNFEQILHILFSIWVFIHRIRWFSRQQGKRRDHLYSFYHFHPFANIRMFLCNFTCEMTTMYFKRTSCNYQSTAQWDLQLWGITIWLIGDDNKRMLISNFCLPDDIILDFVTAIWNEKAVDLNSHRLLSYYNKWID